MSDGRGRKRPHEDLRTLAATETESSTADIEKARRARLQYAETATLLESEFGEPANPSGIAADFGDLAAITDPEHIQR